jgi:hypothetical protein
MSATYGESMASVIILHCHYFTLSRKEKQKHADSIYISRVGKNLHWSLDLKVLHTEILTDLTINLC